MDILDITHSGSAAVHDEPELQNQEVNDEVEAVEASEPEAVESEETSLSNVDEYGNELPPPKMYTEEELNRIIRERVSRFERNQASQLNSPISQSQKQASETGAEESPDWQQELKGFIKNTLSELTVQEQEQQRIMQEQKELAEFEAKFQQGMSRYADFVDVVSKQPITDAMTHATRGMQDPTAFLYAAAKKAPEELQRISKLNPYAQMIEMGKLEMKLKANKPVTNSPRPLAKTKEDVTAGYKETGSKTVDDLIAESARKKLDLLASRFQSQRRR